MKEVIAAIQDKFEADATLVAAVEDLYLNEAPQDAVAPYIIFFLVGDTPDWAFGGIQYEDMEFQFSIYSESESAAEALGIFDKLDACFNKTQLTITGYNQIMMRRIDSLMLLREDDSWHIPATYQVYVRKT